MSTYDEVELEQAVAETLAADRAVPEEWRVAARAAYTWLTIDKELLELSFDSQFEPTDDLRSTATARTLEYAGAGITLEVEVLPDRIMGRLSGAGEVVLERPDHERWVADTDDSGFFTLDAAVTGPVRFTVRVGTQALVTEWVTL